MNQSEKIAAHERVCRNCRYLSCASSDRLRCADPATHDFNREVAPSGTCGRFQISFKAARQLALDTDTTQRTDVWDMTMARHSSAQRISPQ